MDATTPFRRWFRAAGLFALGAAGCQTTDGPTQPDDTRPVSEIRARNDAAYAASNSGAKQPTARPQSPTDPGQLPTPQQPVPAGYVPEPPPTPPAPAGTPAVKVVAVVGSGNIVTDQEVWESVRQRMSEYVSLVDGPAGKQVVRDDAKEKAVYAEELRRIIERELVLDEMYARLKKAGKPHIIDEIKESAGKMADRQLREFKKGYRVKTDDEFRGILAAQGLTLPVIRRQLERQMMAEEYVRSVLKEKGKTVGLAEVRDYYDKHPDEFRTEDRVKWLDIFVSFNKFPTPRAAYDHATEVQKEAAAGADFAALSKQHDHGLAGQQGGEGIGERRGEIQPADVEPAVWDLQPGQVSGLVETPSGYHIVKVVERQRAGVRPFDQKTQDAVRKILMKQLQDREYRNLVENLWRRGVVKVIETP